MGGYRKQGKIRSDKIRKKEKNKKWKSKTMDIEYSLKNHMRKGDERLP